MKAFNHLLTILLLFIGSAVFAQTGVTVFGDCYVAEKGSVGFFIDDLSLKADVQGEGKIIMAGKATQTIEANTKKINHLVINNPTVVKVAGNLMVRKTLTIEQGDLELLPKTQLFLEGAIVNIAKGSHIIDQKILVQRGTGTLPTTQQQLIVGNYGLVNETECEGGRRQAILKYVIQRLLSRMYRPPYLQNMVPPPRA